MKHITLLPLFFIFALPPFITAQFNGSCANCLDMFVEQEEGLSLMFNKNNEWYYGYWHQNEHFYWFDNQQHIYGHASEFKSVDHHTYTRIAVGPRKENNIYPMTFGYWDEDEPKFKTYTEDMQVHYNNDGTVSFTCTEDGSDHRAGKFMTWYNNGQFAWAEERNSAYYPPVCTATGNCDTCKWKAVNGAINDLNIHIVGIAFEEPEDAIQSTPSIVATKSMGNYGTDPQEQTLTVEFENQVSDHTSWSHSWGLELSASAEYTVGIPDIEGASISATVTTSYNGAYGTENTVTKTTKVGDSIVVTCPGRSR
jgi:hypothetical protein